MPKHQNIYQVDIINTAIEYYYNSFNTHLRFTEFLVFSNCISDMSVSNHQLFFSVYTEISKRKKSPNQK